MSEHPRLILGTAGHIDHGKTSLVRALTGVDCDRLPEERDRGITIELGFAPLELPSGTRVGIIDVPGHEKLVRTMVAGATGIDLLMLVVAADEGMMPQTREHLAICELLGVRRGVVALTKIDAVDPELAELARIDVEEELAATQLGTLPVVPVSAHSGEGLDELRALLDTLMAEASGVTAREGPAWLPVDRVFSMKGFGTVVTGTLRGAPLATDETVEIWPDDGKPPLQTRVRGLQVHGEATDVAQPGSRCAVNLQGVELSAVPRGSILAAPGRTSPRRRVDVSLELVAQAPLLRSGSRWMVHLGTTERMARVRLLGSETLAPGTRAFAELRFDRPLPVSEGERFILRGFARLPGAGWTIGGGLVLDADPAGRRRTVAERVAELEVLDDGGRAEALAARLKRAGARGFEREQLERSLRSLEGLEGVRIGERFVEPAAFEALVVECAELVSAIHRDRPEQAWADAGEVERRLLRPMPEPVVRAALEAARERGELEGQGNAYRRPGHSARAGDPELAEQLLEIARAAGLAPQSLSELAKTLGVAVDAIRKLADFLAREGRLVRVTAELYVERGAIDSLRDELVRYLEANERIEPAGFKELTGQSRKFTVPLMEYFDAEKLTVRRDNARVLRGRD